MGLSKKKCNWFWIHKSKVIETRVLALRESKVNSSLKISLATWIDLNQQSWLVRCYFFHGLKLHPQGGQKNIQRVNEQMRLCLWRTSGGCFGTNASLLTLDTMFTGSCDRWWNIHLGSAQNFSNNPVFMSAQGSRRIQSNLNWNNPAIA